LEARDWVKLVMSPAVVLYEDAQRLAREV